ncbi:hypothetical protein BDV93DRAFT_29006 [Ceratobasidium sp. AG-I]|nr:hypothetical protein BDV93DRAFT_29006 [Ceratobasidium sp. AG-I]
MRREHAVQLNLSVVLLGAVLLPPCCMHLPLHGVKIRTTGLRKARLLARSSAGFSVLLAGWP